MSLTTHERGQVQEGASMGAGGGGPAADTPLSVISVARAETAFIVVEELLCKPDCVGVGKRVMRRWRDDATAARVVQAGKDWVVRSAQVLWTVDGVAKALEFGGLKIPRKKEAGPGERCLEDALKVAIDPLAEMRKDDGRRMLIVTGWGMVPRFVTGRLVGTSRTVRVHCGVVKPPILAEIVVRPNELNADTDIYIFP